MSKTQDTWRTLIVPDRSFPFRCSSWKTHATRDILLLPEKWSRLVTRYTRASRVRARKKGTRTEEIRITISEEQLSLTLNILRYAQPLPVERDRTPRGHGGVRAAVTFKEESLNFSTSWSPSSSIPFAPWPRSGRNTVDDILTFTSPPLLFLDL